MTTWRHTPKFEAGSGHGDNRHMRTCTYRGCGKEGANPFFTTTLKEVTSTNRQPKWRCREHEPRKVVSPTNGKVESLNEYRRRHGY